MKINKAMNLYLKHLRATGTPYYTIKGTKYGLKSLSNFLEQEKVNDIENITHDVLAEYQEDLAFRLTAKGTLLSLATREKLIIIVRNFIRYLHEQDYLLHNPAKNIKPPKKWRKLPKAIVSPDEMKTLVHTPDNQTNQGYRDRIILEILYDTGMRRSELANLKIGDMDLQTGYVCIRNGKGGKDRVVPLSQRVCEKVRNYIAFVRPDYIKEKDSHYLILNRSGNKMVPNGIYVVVKRIGILSGIKKNVTTHTMRHTCATHMLRNGASVRHIQEMLGHESLESTQIYTHVTINDLKEIHAKYHPSERKE
jgi:integrase/recombinase XerD